MIFAKYSGAENKFLIALEQKLENLTPALSQKICQKHAVDGALLVKELGHRKFEWRFYNSDGSSAEMCGNAARCVAHFLSEKKLLTDYVQLNTLAGTVGLKKLVDGTLQVEMPEPQKPKFLKLELDGREFEGFFVLAGVPHLILDFPNSYELSKQECRQLRFHPRLQPDGANVTLIKKMSATKALARTYERGVEDFTKACGTGAIAAAAYLQSLILKETVICKLDPMEIQMPGGTLFVEFASPQVLLSGPTEWVGEVQVSPL